MKIRYFILSTILFITVFYACNSNKLNKTINTPIKESKIPAKIIQKNLNFGSDVNLTYPKERHLANIRQLTFGGDNAEAYFSFDNNYLVMQRTNPKDGIDCDHIYYGKIPTSANEDFVLNQISNGKGRTTCSYFLPGDDQIIFASTMSKHIDCPPIPEKRQDGAYVWPLYPSFEIYASDLEGNIIKQYTDNDYYDAEATVSPNRDLIVFTSTQNGDLDLYTCNIDGSNVKQITFELGYDGGAFFTPDGKQLIFRASRPEKKEDIDFYKDLLSKNLVAPTNMELMICDIDGSNLRQITNLGNANWAPFMHPSGKKVVFSSNYKSKVGFPFNLYMINLDGTGLEQITYDGKFDSFPMFSPNGKKFVFSSNRNNGDTRDTNVFIADWVD